MADKKRRGHGPVEVAPEETTKMHSGLKHLSYEDRPREFGLFRDGSGETLEHLYVYKVTTKELKRDFLQWHLVIGQGAMVSN